MIPIRKPNKGPPILATGRGNKITRDFVSLEENGQLNINALKFDSKIYGSKSVKQALIKTQSGKCGFCESRVTHIAYGDVEHFRPKAGFVQNWDDTLVRPGYYWLAYKWENLFFSCQICNQRQKKNHFPLENPRLRARTSKDDLLKERPLFLDPGSDDPRIHIVFKEEVAVALDGSVRGSSTIEAIGLNRPEMLDNRREFLGPLSDLAQLLVLARESVEAAQNLGDTLEKIRTRLRNAAEPKAQYSSMIVSLIRNTGNGDLLQEV